MKCVYLLLVLCLLGAVCGSNINRGYGVNPGYPRKSSHGSGRSFRTIFNTNPQRRGRGRGRGQGRGRGRQGYSPGRPNSYHG
ncbi:hypothetical protein V1264_005427 [Littorina saxatilis]|uniref:Uncharacterized protein n=1 Tax=Littorina saxatilis TaxID=31220 RepID=A0AAN9AZ53_9CAEN